MAESEYLAAHHLHRRKTESRVYLGCAIAIVAGIALAFAGVRILAIVIAGAGAGAFAGDFFQYRLFAPWRLRRLYAQTKLRTFVTYSWDDDKLFARSEHGSSERPWTTFIKARENEESFLLYHNDAIFEIVPKRWFKDVGQIDDFRNHLNTLE